MAGSGLAPAAAPARRGHRGAHGLVVRTRVAPPAQAFGMLVTYRWTAADGSRCGCASRSRPTAPGRACCRGSGCGWPCRARSTASSGSAAAPARPTPTVARPRGSAGSRAGVDELQTPYVYPQENGNRAEVRWATRDRRGRHGLRVDGAPTFDLTARRWTTERSRRCRGTPPTWWPVAGPPQPGPRPERPRARRPAGRASCRSTGWCRRRRRAHCLRGRVVSQIETRGAPGCGLVEARPRQERPG